MSVICWTIRTNWQQSFYLCSRHGAACVSEQLNSAESSTPMRVRTITANAFMAAIEDQDNFRKSQSVAAWLGLVPRRFQSGEVDYDGHISRCSYMHLRCLLHEAAMVTLTRVSPKVACEHGASSSKDGSALSVPPLPWLASGRHYACHVEIWRIFNPGIGAAAYAGCEDDPASWHPHS
jgi:hypothetical protein